MAPSKQARYDPIAAGAACQICPLRGQIVVPPEGPPDALMVLVGETPGYREVQTGRPFVGPSGMALEEILYEVGIPREHLWVSNVLLCRPEIKEVEGKDKFDFRDYLARLRAENTKRKKAAKETGTPFEPIPSPVDCCSMRLSIELAHFERVAQARGQPNGAVVLALGNFALQALTGKQGIMKFRGSPTQASAFPNPDLELDRSNK